MKLFPINLMLLLTFAFGMVQSNQILAASKKHSHGNHNKNRYTVRDTVTVTGLTRLPPNLDALRIPVITYTTTVDASIVEPTVTSFALSSLPFTGTNVSFPANQPNVSQTSTIDGFYAPSYEIVALFLSGANAGQAGIVPLAYDGSTFTVTLGSALPFAPKEGDVVSFQIPETWWINDSEETFIAVNPKNPRNMIISTRQDLFGENSGGVGFLAYIFMYTKDGGRTWNQSKLTLSRDQGATLVGAADDYQSASNGKIVFGVDGNAYGIMTSFNSTDNFDEGNVFIKSTDGGETWTQIYAVEADDGLSHFLDNPYIVADPFRKNTLYVVSADDLFLVGGSVGNVFIQTSKDAGETWTPPFQNVISIVANTVENSFTPTMAVAADRKHTLMVVGNTFDYLLLQPQWPASYTRSVYISRSEDDGATWQQSLITTVPNPNVYDPSTGLNTALETDAQIAASVTSNRSYILYPTIDTSIYPNGQASLALIMSKDAGKTWSKPIAANPKALSAQAFTGSVAVADDGTVAVLLYDFRNFQPNSGIVQVDAWVTLWTKDLEFIQEVRLTKESFNLQTALLRFPITGSFYLGDYTKIVNKHNDFFAAYAVTNSFYTPSFQEGLQPIPLPLTPGSGFMIDSYPRETVRYSKICKRK